MSSKKVCEHSLRWILMARYASKKHGYIVDRFPDFGHSYESYRWTVQQAKEIDKIGLDNWLKTEDALGYGHAIKKLFERMGGS